MVIGLAITKKVASKIQMAPYKCVFEGKAHRFKTKSLKIIIKRKEVIDSLQIPNSRRIGKFSHYSQPSTFPQRQKTITSKPSITITHSFVKINPIKIHYIMLDTERDTVSLYQVNHKRRDHWILDFNR